MLKDLNFSVEIEHSDYDEPLVVSIEDGLHEPSLTVNLPSPEHRIDFNESEVESLLAVFRTFKQMKEQHNNIIKG